jgi:hypothetical protein
MQKAVNHVKFRDADFNKQQYQQNDAQDRIRIEQEYYLDWRVFHHYTTPLTAGRPIVNRE